MASKFCFVISPISEKGSATRRRADGVLTEIIRPALEPEYRVERADHDKTPGIVTEGIIAKIIDADLVIADLTGLNPNVMYELAVRHAVAKPVIQILEEGQTLPFDVHAQNTIKFTSDLSGRSEAIREIKAAESAVGGAADMGNPIKRAAELRNVLRTGTDQEGFLARAVADIRAELANIRIAMISKRPGESEIESPARFSISLLGEMIFSDQRLKDQGITVRKLSVAQDQVSAQGMWQDQVFDVVLPNHKIDTAQSRFQTVEDMVAQLLMKAALLKTLQP